MHDGHMLLCCPDIHHKMLKDDVGGRNGNLTDKLEETLNGTTNYFSGNLYIYISIHFNLYSEASEKASQLFDTVLQSKDRADSIRNTLNVLQRFKVCVHFLY